MGAVTVITILDQIPQLREVTVQFLRLNVPEGQGLQSRQVGYKTAAFEREHFPDDCRVPALFIEIGNLVGPQVQGGIDAVDDSRFPDTGRPDKAGDAVGQQFPDLFDPGSGFSRNIDGAVAEGRIITEQFPGFFLTQQIDLVHDDDRRDLLFFTHHQKPVQHPQPGLGMGAGKDQKNLVHVADEYLTVFDLDAGCHADQFVCPRFYRFNDAAAVRQDLKFNQIADSDDIRIFPSAF